MRKRYRELLREEVAATLDSHEDLDEELQRLAAQGKVRLGGAPLDETFWALPAPRVRAAAVRRALDQERDDRGR